MDTTDPTTNSIKLKFDDNATADKQMLALVANCLKDLPTLEAANETPLVICQDGKSKGYYVRCTMSAAHASPLLDMNAKLNPSDAESFRANRELLTEHNTFKRMVSDAKDGREFNDIIVEFTKEYGPSRPLKIWGGQHRAKAIQQSFKETNVSRYHGFKIFFNLSKSQRTELALTSNTNIAVSNDLFDRLQEETFVGIKLREWCYQVALLKKPEDFPDLGSRAERVTVKLARTFITNFFLGKRRGNEVNAPQLDRNVYEPYLCESGFHVDSEYEAIVKKLNDKIWADSALIEAGKAFANLHKAQYEAVRKSDNTSLKNLKGFRNKALTESVLSSWAFVAGLLQTDSKRLINHYSVPKTTKNILDPLNAREMSIFSHDSDEATYRGLGTRSALKDRQRMAQLFLARSLNKDTPIDKALMNKAVSQVVGIKSIEKGYTT
jgi:hypothetical protein